MPIDIQIGTKKIRLQPTNEWQKSTESITSIKDITVFTNKFYIKYN